MAIQRYLKAEFLDLLQNAVCDIDSFYAQGFLNYRGITSDTKERYEDIAAEFVLDNLAALGNIKAVELQSSYKTDGHEQLIPDVSKIKEIKAGAIRRQEEWLAKSMYGKDYEHLGKIIDFQVPIKDVRGSVAGKIDLISFSENDNILYLLEFKKSNSQETLLRCILETYTYYKQVNHAKLLKDFNFPANSQVIPAVLIYKQSFAATGLGDLSLQKLRNTLGVSIFLINETGGIDKA